MKPTAYNQIYHLSNELTRMISKFFQDYCSYYTLLSKLTHMRFKNPVKLFYVILTQEINKWYHYNSQNLKCTQFYMKSTMSK